MSQRLGTISLSPKGNESPYSSYFLKSMFGISQLPKNGLRVKGDSKTFNDLAPEYTEGNSVSGAQKKLLMSLVNGFLVPVKKNGQFIVKPAPDKFPHLPENEHCIMQLAKAVGFDVAQNALVPFENGELAYLTKRFDILKNSERLFIEDAASLCLVAPANKGSDALSYEDTLNTLFTVSGQNRGVTLNGFKQILFAYIVGNNDLHLKNLSLFRQPNSQSRFMTNFTPIYDVLSVAPYPMYFGDDLSLSLLNSELEAEFSEAYEQYGYYTGYDFIKFGQQIGLPNSAAKKIIKQLSNDVKIAYEYIINASQCPDDMKRVLKSHIKDKLGRLTRPYPVKAV
tara:strand:- start:349 stop:1365 length:1017 start_codon:yes stop_codon:yes gene_type:complete